MHYFFKKSFLLSGIDQTEGVVIGLPKIINFMTPRPGVLVIGCCHLITVKMHYFFKNLLY